MHANQALMRNVGNKNTGQPTENEIINSGKYVQISPGTVT